MNTERLNVVVPPEQKQQVEEIAKQMHISKNSLVRIAIAEFVEKWIEGKKNDNREN